MILFTFAHRGEAREFLQKGGWRPLEFAFPGLFQEGENFLLITGEGIQNATQKLAAVLSCHRKTIKKVLNFGVAGALDPALELGQVVDIRTVYLEPSQKGSSFHSFSSTVLSCPPSVLDCLTAQSRVMDQERADYLSHFAQVVDRELWALASVCHLFQVPFHSCKLLIDRARSRTCQDHTRAQYQEYAQKLYEACQTRFLSGPPSAQPEKEEPRAVPLPEGCYFTTAQERRYQSLLLTLEKKYSQKSEDILAGIGLERLRNSPLGPKNRTKKLLGELEVLASPHRLALKRKLEELCAPLAKTHCQIQFAGDFEDSSFRLNAHVKNEVEFERLQKALADFPYSRVVKILNGEEDYVP